jgi:hypothetical protein
MKTGGDLRLGARLGTVGEWGSPTRGISCQVAWGNESWQQPERYWFPSPEGEVAAGPGPVAGRSRTLRAPWRRRPALYR